MQCDVQIGHPNNSLIALIGCAQIREPQVESRMIAAFTLCWLRCHHAIGVRCIYIAIWIPHVTFYLVISVNNSDMKTPQS
jgi:hypothetical protein